MLAGFDVRKADYHAIAEILKQAIIEKQPAEWVARQCANTVRRIRRLLTRT